MSTQRRRWSDRADAEQDDDTVPEFDQTLSSDLEDTVRNLRALPSPRSASHYTPESLSFQQAVIHAQTDELRTLREQVAKLTHAMSYKASKKSVDERAAELSAKIDKRLDGMRNWAILVIMGVGMLMTILGGLGLLRH